MAKLVAKRYATAIFELGKETSKLDQYEEEVNTIISILESEEDFVKLIENPKIVKDKKIRVLENIFMDKISNEILGLMVTIVNKGRQNALLDIFNEFIDMVKDEKGIVTAYITSAIELKPEQVDRIKQNLESKLNKTIEIETSIDESILGGMIIRVNEQIIDNSVKGKINNIKAVLRNIQLA